jgi:hypothetical protein
VSKGAKGTMDSTTITALQSLPWSLLIVSSTSR